MIRPIIAVLLLSGCATFDGYEWTRSARPDLPVQWYVATQEELRADCFPPDSACARYGPYLCTIIAEQDEAHTPDWLVRHERRHCAGWDHL